MFLAFAWLGLAAQVQRDECGCPACPKCPQCRACRKCPQCPTPIPCPGCPECPDVGRCRVCEKCRPCAPPVVFYVPKGAFIDPFDQGTPSPETANLIPGMCCRCPKRRREGEADAEKFVDKSEDENSDTRSWADRIDEMKKKVEENRREIRRLKEKRRKYRKIAE